MIPFRYIGRNPGRKVMVSYSCLSHESRGVLSSFKEENDEGSIQDVIIQPESQSHPIPQHAVRFAYSRSGTGTYISWPPGPFSWLANCKCVFGDTIGNW